MRQPPAAILFDLDETLITAGDRAALFLELLTRRSEALADVPVEEIVAELEAAFTEFWADEDRHRQWRYRLFDARALVIGRVLESFSSRAPELTPDFARHFSLAFDETQFARVTEFPGAIATVDRIRSRGVKLALVTNGQSKFQRSKIDRFELARRFDHVQIEEEVGFGKPMAEAYIHAMSALGVDPLQTWMVGDNLEWEVVAPQRLGIFSIWHDHRQTGLPANHAATPDHIVRSIPEVADLF